MRWLTFAAWKNFAKSHISFAHSPSMRYTALQHLHESGEDIDVLINWLKSNRHKCPDDFNGEHLIDELECIRDERRET